MKFSLPSKSLTRPPASVIIGTPGPCTKAFAYCSAEGQLLKKGPRRNADQATPSGVQTLVASRPLHGIEDCSYGGFHAGSNLDCVGDLKALRRAISRSVP